MTIDDTLLQSILDAGNAALVAEAGDVTAETALQASVASLTAQLAPNPTLSANVASFLTKALAANPPAPAAVAAATAVVAPAIAPAVAPAATPTTPTT